MKKYLAIVLLLLSVAYAIPASANTQTEFFDSFKISQTDTPGTTNYYLFVSPSGMFYIMKEAVSSNVKTYTYYAALATLGDYATAWTGRAGLTYAAVEVAFKAVR